MERRTKTTGTNVAQRTPWQPPAVRRLYAAHAENGYSQGAGDGTFTTS